mmetsp:Transcript_27610/g.60800  ORF Transcript_27610/g.60800 Transcript_27610/m.60800 type:complete len:91 (-) Transcript_27610:118-390(-)
MIQMLLQQQGGGSPTSVTPIQLHDRHRRQQAHSVTERGWQQWKFWCYTCGIIYPVTLPRVVVPNQTTTTISPMPPKTTSEEAMILMATCG